MKASAPNILWDNLPIQSIIMIQLQDDAGEFCDISPSFTAVENGRVWFRENKGRSVHMEPVKGITAEQAKAVCKGIACAINNQPERDAGEIFRACMMYYRKQLAGAFRGALKGSRV